MKSLTSLKRIQTPRFLHSNILAFPGLNQFTFQKNISDNKVLFLQKRHHRRVQSGRIKISREEQKTWLGIYQWRSNTELPIVKTYYISINQENSKFVEIQIYNEYIPIRLSQLNDIPINQILYLMKQSLIGWQRIFCKYGGFQINSNMLGINENKKCRVWMNENFEMNSSNKIEIDEKTFIKKVIEMFSQYTLRTSLSKQFFQSFIHISKFVSAFKYIDHFAQSKNLFIPLRFQLQPKQFSLCNPSLEDKITEQDALSSDSENSSSINLSEKFIKRPKLNPLKKDKQKSIKAQTQIGYEMKCSNGTTKANSNRDVMISFTIRDDQTEYLNEQISDLNICTIPQTLYKKGKLESIFKSDINSNCEQPNQNKQKKLRKFSGYNYKHQSSYTKPKIESLNSIEQTILQQKCDINKQTINQKKKKPIIDQSQVTKVAKAHCDEMFKKNGWQNILTDLLTSDNPMKESITMGKEISNSQPIQLQKLGTLGRSIKESIVCSSIQE